MKRRYLVLFVVLPAAFALAVAIFYQVENRRGVQAWEQTARELAARGEPLDLAALVPPVVPDDQSLAKAPVIARALNEGYITDDSAMPAAFSDLPLGRGVHQSAVAKDDWTTGRPLPLADWQRQLAKSKQLRHSAGPGTPAADVLTALTVFAPLLDEVVRETETRPQADAPIDWRQEPAAAIRFPAGPLYVKIVSALRLRACAELAGGRHELALRDTLAALRLCEALGREPLMIGLLEDCLATPLALQPVWEGLAAKRWTTDELQRLQPALRRDDYLGNYVRTVRGERVIAWLTMESIRQSITHGKALFSGGSGRPVALAEELIAGFFTVVPRGWIDWNKVNAARAYQACIDTVDLRARRILPDKVAAADTELSALGKKPFLVYTLAARMLVLQETYFLPRVAHQQTACDLAEIACALERHLLERGVYPDALDALVPDYLDRVPTDVMDGSPLRYRRTDDGRYFLYGVGWNGRDEDGMLAWRREDPPKRPFRPNEKEGDWVWQYTPLDPPAGLP